jgi:adenine-specific DNA-methyltransferase
MSEKFEKLQTLLRELFQLDQPDLDFGIYRILHARSAEITQFLDKDLLPQVQTELLKYESAEIGEAKKALAARVELREKLGDDPEKDDEVQRLRKKVAEGGAPPAELENDVYDHLFGFFRRYYSDGDFLAKRVYKPGVYAIPYEGEEVKLHWANHDQYYIKTSEYLRDYAFRLRPDDEQNPMRVHLRLVDAAEGEHGDVKPPNGKDRVFVLAPPGDSGQDFIVEENGELVIRFEYRPATLTDWPESIRSDKTKPPAQKDLITLGVSQALAVALTSFNTWIVELAKQHFAPSGKKADYSRLHAHICRYTARNTFDYLCAPTAQITSERRIHPCRCR